MKTLCLFHRDTRWGGVDVSLDFRLLVLGFAYNVFPKRDWWFLYLLSLQVGVYVNRAQPDPLPQPEGCAA